MKLLIDGREYPAVDHSNASLLHLMELKQQTREFTDDGHGLGMAALERIGRDAAAAQAAGETPQDADLWSAVIVFLTRRAAGDKVTFLEAIDIPLSALRTILEPGDQPSGAADGSGVDPTTPGPGSPATPASGAALVPPA